MPLEINYYDLSIHKLMLRDQVRCEAFRKALAETITPGCAVLDIGAGTGILSLFAAQAGARVVYAIERTDTAEIARRLVLENGLEDKIKIFQSDMESVEIPEKVDVIVSEWLGGYGIDENLLPYDVKQFVYPSDEGEEPGVQFRHYLDEIFNGLRDNGLSLERVFDEPSGWTIVIVAKKRGDLQQPGRGDAVDRAPNP